MLVVHGRHTCCIGLLLQEEDRAKAKRSSAKFERVQSGVYDIIDEIFDQELPSDEARKLGLQKSLGVHPPPPQQQPMEEVNGEGPLPPLCGPDPKGKEG